MHWYELINNVSPNAILFHLKGHSKQNEGHKADEIYKKAKEPIPSQAGWNKTNYTGRSQKITEVWVNEVNNGWLGFKIPEGLMILDVDRTHRQNAPELIDTILQEMNVKCHRIVTPNGRQFVFNVPEFDVKQVAGQYNLLGISVDTRTHGKGYIVLPTPNTDGRYFESIEDEIDTFPDWLTPLWTTPSDGSDKALPNYPIESGRNDFLFRWCSKMASQGQSKEQVSIAAHIIGKYLMVIKEGDDWGEEEINAVLDSVFKDEYVEARQVHLDEWTQKQLERTGDVQEGQWWQMSQKGFPVFKHHIMARFIRQNFHVIRYGDESGIMYYYDADEGYYKMDANHRLLNETIRNLDETLTIHQVREVAQSIYETSKKVAEWHQTHIPVKNGLWDVNEKGLRDFTPDVYLDYKIDVNYDENAYSEFINETLDKISNYHEPTRTNLEEILGSVVSPELLPRYAWFLFGRTAHNGKSFFLHMIMQLVSQKFIGGLSPHDVAKSQFKVAELYGKRVNLIDEIGTAAIPEFDKIKSLITGGVQSIEFKGKGAFTAKIECVQVWASNFFPNIREEGNQVNRRLEIIPFDFNFTLDPNKLADTVAENLAKEDSAKEYLLRLAIDGMYRLMLNKGEPSPNEKRVEQKEEFVMNNDKLGDWLAESGYDKTLAAKEDGCYDVIDYESCNDIYKRYVNWNTDRGEDRRYMYSRQRLENELMKRFNLKKERKRLHDFKTGKEADNAVKRFIRNTG